MLGVVVGEVECGGADVLVELLGWVQVTSGVQHRTGRNHPRRGAAVGVWLAEVVQQVVSPASVSRCNVMLPWQQAEPPFPRRA